MSQSKEGESLLSNEVSIRENSSDSDEASEAEPEGWYGWLVVAACFTCVCVLDGVGYSYGILLEPLIEEFQEGRGLLSVAGSLQVGVYGLSSPLVSRLVESWGERRSCLLGAALSSSGLLLASLARDIQTLVLSYSLLAGLGFGLMYLPSVVLPSKHFTRRRSLATGLVLCAAGAGTFLLAPLSQALLARWGWRGAMRGLALLSAACLGCGALMTSPASTTARHRPGPTSITSITSSPALSVFLMLGLADMLSTLSLYMPYTHLPSAVAARGVSSSQAAVLISSLGVSSSLARLLAGWLSDQASSHPQLLLAGAITAATPCLFLLAFVNQFWLLLVLCICFGLLTGVWVSTIPPALIRLLGLHSLSLGFGLLSFSRGTAALAGPPLAGFVVDLLEDRNSAILVAAGIMAASSLCFTISALAARRWELRRLYMEI